MKLQNQHCNVFFLFDFYLDRTVFLDEVACLNLSNFLLCCSFDWISVLHHNHIFLVRLQKDRREYKERQNAWDYYHQHLYTKSHFYTDTDI